MSSPNPNLQLQTIGVGLGYNFRLLRAQGNQLHELPHDGTAPKAQSIICFRNEGEFITGPPAVHGWKLNPSTTFCNFSPLLGLHPNELAQIPYEQYTSTFQNVVHTDPKHGLIVSFDQCTDENDQPLRTSWCVLYAAMLHSIHRSFGHQLPGSNSVDFIHNHVRLLLVPCPGKYNSLLHGLGLAYPAWYSPTQCLHAYHCAKLADLPLTTFISEPLAALHTYTLTRQHTAPQSWVGFIDIGFSHTTLSLAFVDAVTTTSTIEHVASQAHLGLHQVIDSVRDILIRKALMKLEPDVEKNETKESVKAIMKEESKSGKYLVLYTQCAIKALHDVSLTSNIDAQITLPTPCGVDHEVAITLSRSDFKAKPIVAFITQLKTFLETTLNHWREFIKTHHNPITSSPLPFYIEQIGAGERAFVVKDLLDSLDKTGFDFRHTMNTEEAIVRGVTYAAIDRVSWPKPVLVFDTAPAVPDAWKISETHFSIECSLDHLVQRYKQLVHVPPMEPLPESSPISPSTTITSSSPVVPTPRSKKSGFKRFFSKNKKRSNPSTTSETSIHSSSRSATIEVPASPSVTSPETPSAGVDSSHTGLFSDEDLSLAFEQDYTHFKLLNQFSLDRKLWHGTANAIEQLVYEDEEKDEELREAIGDELCGDDDDDDDDDDDTQLPDNYDDFNPDISPTSQGITRERFIATKNPLRLRAFLRSFVCAWLNKHSSDYDNFCLGNLLQYFKFHCSADNFLPSEQPCDQSQLTAFIEDDIDPFSICTVPHGRNLATLDTREFSFDRFILINNALQRDVKQYLESRRTFFSSVNKAYE